MNEESHTARRHGIRFSTKDAFVLLLTAGLSWWLMNQNFPLWWIVPAALGHFFLFCNVFRVWRRLELLWAGAFVINVAGHLVLGTLDWLSPMLFQLPVTVLVITLQIRSPWYHGILAKQFNPRIKQYLNAELL